MSLGSMEGQKGRMLLAQQGALSAEIDEWLNDAKQILADPQLDAYDRDQLQELREKLGS